VCVCVCVDYLNWFSFSPADVHTAGQEVHRDQGNPVSMVFVVPTRLVRSSRVRLMCVCACRDFSWSPTDNLIAYWVPARDSIPAKIIIIEVPSRKEICTKSRHEVKEVRSVSVQTYQGVFLCVCVWRT